MRFQVLLVLSIFILSSCVHRSVLKREDDEHRKEVVQYCGGQLWGYVLSLDKTLKSSPYLALYTELTRFEKKEVLLLHLAFNFKNAAQFTTSDRSLKISIAGQPEKNQPVDLALFQQPKNINQLYPSHKYTVRSSSQPGEYVISKMKYGGMFGEFALEEPFILKAPEPVVSKVTTDTVQISFDSNKDDEVYLRATTVLLTDPVASSESHIVVSLPKFLIDGKEFNLSPFVFNFNREQILSRAAKAARCPSLEMMFHWDRNSFVIPNFIID